MALLSWLLLLTAGAAAAGLAILIGGIIRVFSQAPRLEEQATPLAEGSLTVVVPAYNEAANIAACIGLSLIHI